MYMREARRFMPRHGYIARKSKPENKVHSRYENRNEPITPFDIEAVDWDPYDEDGNVVIVDPEKLQFYNEFSYAFEEVFYSTNRPPTLKSVQIIINALEEVKKELLAQQKINETK